MAKLILNPTSSARREIALSRSLISIGRDPSNDLVLPDAMVSRRHAVIEFRSSQYFLRDCNSSNGSLVNGDRVSERNLRDGDLVAIGSARILFKEEVVQEGGAKVVPHPSAPRQHCPTCGSDYRKGDAFCRNCGGALALGPPRVVCTACGTVVPLPAKFCNACGGGLAGGEVQGKIPEPEAKTEEPEPPRPIGGSSPVAAAVEAAPVVVDLPLKSPPPPKPWLEPQRESRPEPRALSSELATPALERPARRARGERRAEAGPRFVAAIIDFGIVLLGELLLLSPVAYYWSKRTPAATDDVHFWPILLSVSFVLFVWALGVGYFVYYWGVVGQTPGKAAAGIEVRGIDGRYPIGLPTAFARLFGYVVSTALLGIGFVLVLFGRDALHDKIAGTKVVFREKG